MVFKCVESLRTDVDEQTMHLPVFKVRLQMAEAGGKCPGQKPPLPSFAPLYFRLRPINCFISRFNHGFVIARESRQT